MPKPSVELVRRAMETIKTSADADYFFDRLTSPDWIAPLREVGMFQAPPPPIREGNYVQFPAWSESRYLARVAGQAPDAVAEIILALPPTENTRVLGDLADAVLAMAPELAVRLVPNVAGWLATPNLLLLPDRLGKLIGRLATAGHVDPALELARALLRLDPGTPGPIEGTEVVRPAEPRPLFEPYEYQRILSSIVPELVRAGGAVTLGLLCDLLAQAIKLSRFDEDEQSGEDYSYLWRSAVEPNDQNHHHDVKDALIDAVRDAAETLLQSDPDQLEPTLRHLEQRSSMFRRVGLHLLRRFAEGSSELVADRLLDTELLYGITCYHEYWHLLQARFRELSAEKQNALLADIAAGPVSYREKAEPELSEADLRSRLEAWQWRMLAAIKDDLPPEWAEKYRELVAPRGEPEHPDLLSYVGGMWSGPTSPTTAAQLEGMSTDDIVQLLQTWQPTGEWHSPTPEGLGRDLSAAVRADPDRFAADADKFRALDPTYVRSFLWGLREAATNKEVFPWPAVLQLSALAVSQPPDLPGRESTFGGLDLDPGWGWAHKTVADLIGVGLRVGPSEIPYELREIVWQVLEPLSDHEEPTPDYEDRYGGSNMDPMTLAINTVRGEAIEAVIHYALWVHRHLEQQPERAALLARGLEELPEVRTVLERHLDPANDPALAIRSLYGRWLPWLILIDEPWVVEHLTQVFPSTSLQERFWEAAWDAYVSFCPAYDRPFELLLDQYRHAIERLGGAIPEGRHPHGVESHLASHLMTMYWRGKLPFESGGLLEAFYARADDELRAWALNSIGRGLQTIEPAGGPPTPAEVEPEVVERLMALWSRRLAAAESSGDREAYAKELAEFGSWFSSQVFPESWALDQLLAALRSSGRADPSHLVLGRLAGAAAAFPRQAIEALKLMIQGDSEGWTVLGWENEVTDVLSIVLGSGDTEARSAAVDVIHELGARGHRDYRALLPASQPKEGST